MRYLVLLFDTHCHLQDAAFDEDREAMIAASRAVSVSHFMVPATDTANLESTVNLANSHENVYCALGIHPHSASEWNSDIRSRIRDVIQSNEKVRAVGEIGLDYHYDFSPRDVQRKAFAEQIELAIELHKPIVIHTRESEEDVFRIIEEHYGGQDVRSTSLQPPGQFHCFSLGHEFLHRALDLGFYISYTGNITFKNSNLAAIVNDTPLDRLMLETDSPYLTPAPNRGKRNSPAYLPFIAQKAAEIKNLDLPTLMQSTFNNALRLFRIAFPIVMIAGMFALTPSASRAQERGIQPPDSVLTGNRRQAEELRKKQQEELAKEAEQHRLDSIKAEQKSLEEAQAAAREQLRQDSIRAAQETLAEEQHAAFLLTPEPWRAIGFGANAGGGSMHIGTPVLTATSVFAYGFQLNTEVTRRLDVSLFYSHFQVGGDYSSDSLFNYGPHSGLSTTYNPNLPPPKGFNPAETRLVRSESLDVSQFGVDLHYVITRPTAVVKFYFGLGYQHLVMTSKQHFFHMVDPVTPLGGNSAPVDSSYQQNWSRNGIDLLFGMKHDFELGSGFTIEPFAEISGTGVFNGPFQDPSFVLQPDVNDLIVVNFRAGFTLYYGWWGVKREE